MAPVALSMPTWDHPATWARSSVQNPLQRVLEDEATSLPGRTREVIQLLPELSLHGLSQGDSELALRGLPLSVEDVEGQRRQRGPRRHSQARHHHRAPVIVMLDTGGGNRRNLVGHSPFILDVQAEDLLILPALHQGVGDVLQPRHQATGEAVAPTCSA